MLKNLNSTWHRQSLWIFFFITIAHLAEHVVQIFQIYIMGVLPPEARGMLGKIWPWLMQSEVLHYGYALVMLIGLLMLRQGFVGNARHLWDLAIFLQFWHHFEHVLILWQAMNGSNWWGSPIPTSILQIFWPRAELHFVYNAVVYVPMAMAMIVHSTDTNNKCNCQGNKMLDALSAMGLAMLAITFIIIVSKEWTNDEKESRLLLTPEGKYTAQDIKANGNVIASRRYAGFDSNHDVEAKKGDLICPVTATKADQRCSWVVDGKTYYFCCPPCIVEFVKTARETPDKIKAPDFYKK